MCDLTLANTRAIRRTLISQWKVDEEARTGSDHVVIRFTVVNKRIATGEIVTERPNWRNANGKAYNKAFRAALDETKYVMIGHDEPGTSQKRGVRGRSRRDHSIHSHYTPPAGISLCQDLFHRHLNQKSRNLGMRIVVNAKHNRLR